jgi:hypothetical protein
MVIAVKDHRNCCGMSFAKSMPVIIFNDLCQFRIAVCKEIRQLQGVDVLDL